MSDQPRAEENVIQITRSEVEHLIAVGAEEAARQVLGKLRQVGWLTEEGALFGMVVRPSPTSKLRPIFVMEEPNG